MEFVRAQRRHYGQFKQGAMTMEEALRLLDGMVDESDPDLRDTPQSVHAFQTAEALRRARPSRVEVRSLFEPAEWEALPPVARDIYEEFPTVGALVGNDVDEWLPVVGLIHDVGKVLALSGELPQWAVVGDTFPVGCAFSPANIHHDKEWWRENPDWAGDTLPACDPVGMYKEGAGLEQLLCRRDRLNRRER